MKQEYAAMESVVERLLAIEAQIEHMEQTIPRDKLPPEYDDLVKRRDAERALIESALDEAMEIPQLP